MDILNNKTDKELVQSIIAEIAKSKNEIACAQADLTKAQNRLGFLIMLSNNLLNRLE